jgi:hypothetical protein
MQALASERLVRPEVPQVQPEVSGIRANTWRSFATEEIVLNTAPTTFNRRVTPSRARRGHGDGHLTVYMHGRAHVGLIISNNRRPLALAY